MTAPTSPAPHICAPNPICSCRSDADEPRETCEIHGIGQARCSCGKYATASPARMSEEELKWIGEHLYVLELPNIDVLYEECRRAREAEASLALTVKALTPAANYCLEYKPLLLAEKARADAAEAEIAALKLDIEVLRGDVECDGSCCHEAEAELQVLRPFAGTDPARGIEKMTREILDGRAENERLRKAILWALGERDDFPDRPSGAGAYWWRTELRRRATLAAREEGKK